MDKERIIKTLSDRRFMPWLWVALGVISALCKMKAHNNFDIFRYVFYNTWQGTSLYAPATDGGFWDINHYGRSSLSLSHRSPLCPNGSVWCYGAHALPCSFIGR